MLEKLKAGVDSFWGYSTAMMTDMRDGQRALSFTRVLGIAMFLYCLQTWTSGVEVQDGALQTLWVLLGVKATKDAVTSFRK